MITHCHYLEKGIIYDAMDNYAIIERKQEIAECKKVKGFPIMFQIV